MYQYCMENIDQCQQFYQKLPQNTTVIQSEHTEQYSKDPMRAPSSGSFLIASEHDCGLIRTYGAVFKSSNDSAM